MMMQYNDVSTVLHRFSIKSGHVDQYIDIWHRIVKLRQKHGFKIIFANIGLEHPKFTWCYTYQGDIDDAEKRYRADPESASLVAEARKHVYTNDLIRRVNKEYMTPMATQDSIKGKTLIMRRYNIKRGEWDDFLDVWRQILPLREQYGFKCLFALSDIEESMFTWAFEYEGEYKDFKEKQVPYYADPKRVELENVMNYMTDFSIVPVRPLIIP